MNEMELWEIDVLVPMIEYSVKNEWEQARFVSYITALVNTSSKKKLKITDLMKFPWDEDKEYEEEKPKMTLEDKKKLDEKSKMFERLLNKSHD